MERRLEIEYLNLLPLEYKKEIENVIEIVNGDASYDAKNEACHNFVEKFTTVPEIFEIWRCIISRVSDCNKIKLFWNNLHKRCNKDFPQKEGEWPKIEKNRRLNFKKSLAEELETLESLLSLPHSGLTYAYDIYQEISLNPMPKELVKKYHDSHQLYQEIKQADINDGEKYIEALKKTKKDEFVIKNVECQLAKNPWSQSLWEAYIQYLEENEKKDGMKLLSVLQRYCRLFIADKAMKEKYRSKIEEFSESLDGVSEFWIDSIKFELQFNGKEAAMDMVEKAVESNMKDFLRFCDKAMKFSDKYNLSDIAVKVKDAERLYLKDHATSFEYKYVIRNLNFNNPIEPQLPFGKLVNAYILKNVDYPHLLKLYQTCKWFYYKYRYNLVHKLRFCGYGNGGNIIEFTNDSLNLYSYQFDFSSLNNLWLTYSLVADTNYNLGSILKKLTKISLKVLHFHAHSLHVGEYKLLTASKTIEKLFLYDCGIYEGGVNELIPLVDVLKEVPRARHLLLTRCETTYMTSKMLSIMKFENKFESLRLHVSLNNPKLFFKFLKNNLAPCASLDLLVYGNSSKNFHEILEKKIEKWQPFNERPLFQWVH